MFLSVYCSYDDSVTRCMFYPLIVHMMFRQPDVCFIHILNNEYQFIIS
jgi:hypothetical protein